MMKKLLAVVVLGMSTLSINVAMARDGANARHGGVVATAGDKLEAKGIKLTAGAKVVAALTTPAKKAITVRFTVK